MNSKIATEKYFAIYFVSKNDNPIVLSSIYSFIE